MDEQKDANVYSFMMQLAQEKFGDEIDGEHLKEEADGMYEIFGAVLLQYFEPQLSGEQKEQFDQLIEGNESQDVLMQFLIENIENLEQQIVQVLVKFREDYLNGEIPGFEEKKEDRYEEGLANGDDAQNHVENHSENKKGGNQNDGLFSSGSVNEGNNFGDSGQSGMGDNSYSDSDKTSSPDLIEM